ncbi:MAG TPA: VOC family protein [Candidatus Eisenbacteria bacterium]|nr:VOC family protein [Candidatus Eisenbacteria bacterium]
MTANERFNVGGVLLDRPFKIRRLGHFGFNLTAMDEGVRFYVDLLGFRVSDKIDYAARASDPRALEGLGDPHGYFTRYGTDHHALVLFNKRVREALGRREKPGVTVNQITWQVGSLREVRNAIEWFTAREIKIQRSGRDMPGSNWHTYLLDPDGHQNELYYGIEQIGWNGFSKPKAMYDRGFDQAPPLPQISEQQEVDAALERNVDLLSGYRHTDGLRATYDVDGILLPRPFKIVRLGPVSLFVEDLDRAEAFYRDTLGFILTEETIYQGHRCLFLRCNTEHHALALFPLRLRDVLGLSAHSKCAALGLQLATYRQLRDAIGFLRSRGVEITEALPPELHPGIEYAAHARDPDGHWIQLYFAMEQIGWDGKPRPKEARKPRPLKEWPEALEAHSDAYLGEPFPGPWG